MIRKGTIEDINELENLSFKMVKESKFNFMEYSSDKVKEFLKDVIEGDHFLQVALDEGKIVGMYVGYVSPTPFSYDLVGRDEAFFVLPEYRGRIHAKELLQSFIDWCEEKKAKFLEIRISTEVLLESTTRLHEKFGFEKTGIIMKRV